MCLSRARAVKRLAWKNVSSGCKSRNDHRKIGLQREGINPWVRKVAQHLENHSLVARAASAVSSLLGRVVRRQGGVVHIDGGVRVDTGEGVDVAHLSCTKIRRVVKQKASRCRSIAGDLETTQWSEAQ